MNAAQLERSLYSLVAQAIAEADEPVANEIAAKVLPELSPEQAQHLLLRGVAEQVRVQLNRAKGREVAMTGSARWDQVARGNEDGTLDIARINVWNGALPKWLPDCTVDDLAGGVHHNRSVGEGHLRFAEQLERIEKMLRRKSGAKVVADLDPEKVKSVFQS